MSDGDRLRLCVRYGGHREKFPYTLYVLAVVPSRRGQDDISQLLTGAVSLTIRSRLEGSLVLWPLEGLPQGETVS